VKRSSGGSVHVIRCSPSSPRRDLPKTASLGGSYCCGLKENITGYWGPTILTLRVCVQKFCIGELKAAGVTGEQNC